MVILMIFANINVKSRLIVLIGKIADKIRFYGDIDVRIDLA